MNEQEPQVDPKRSKCWQCRFGMTVHESELERVYHAGMSGMGLPQPPSNDFDIFDGTPYQDAPPSPPEGEGELIEHTIEHERIKTICFWRPAGIEAPPIVVANVKDCSRFEEKKP